MKQLVLSIRNLTIRSEGGGHAIVDNISLDVAKGEVVALVGESGSGKSTIGLSCLGLFRPGLTYVGGDIELEGSNLLGLPPRELQSLRGRRVAYVAQSAAASFNPAIKLNSQVIEPSIAHGTRSASEALDRAISLYATVRLPQPNQIGSRYPHEVSGGQLQRFMLAMGMLDAPALLVLDEPTSALDVTTQVEVLMAMKSAVSAQGTSALFISHDLPVVAQMADRVVVLRNGRIVESGPTNELLHSPKEAYTRELIAAFRKIDQKRLDISQEQDRKTVLSVQDLSAGYGGRTRAGKPSVLAVENASFNLARGEVLAVVGESGSGKTSLAQAIAGLLPRSVGSVRLHDVELSASLGGRTKDQLRRVQLVFQMADTALNPKHTIARTLERVLEHFFRLPAAQREKRIEQLLALVQLPPEIAARYPRQLSGGQKQRVNLARALAAEPDVLICDEVTSALDTIVSVAVLDLIRELKAKLGLAVLFVSHDLAAISGIADQTIVMRRGKIVEAGETAVILDRPKHPYTQLLVSSVPELRANWLQEAAPRNEALAKRIAAGV